MLIPFAWSKNIFDIDIDFYKKLDCKVLLIDLDNTLDNHTVKVPSKRVIELFDKLKTNNLDPIIVSNNNEKRVSSYASKLNCKYLYRCKKPFSKKINSYLLKEHINKNNVIMIGDQLMTDVRCAKRLGVKSILLEKLWPNEQFVTKLLRWLDNLKRRRLRKNNLLKDWREVYGRIK